MSRIKYFQTPNLPKTPVGEEQRLSDDVITALLACFHNVAWVSDQGSTLYNALEAALTGTSPSPQPILPSAYQQVAYIESAGGAYFTTNIEVPNNYKVVAKASRSTAPSSAQSVCGGLGVNNAYRSYLSFSENQNYIGCWYGALNNFFALNNLNSYPVEAETKFQKDTNGEKLVFSATNTSASNSATVDRSATIEMDTTPALKVFWHGDTTNGIFAGKVYYVRVEDANGNITANLIPCYRLSDNKIGMYDVINSAFYYSDTSTQFTKGANVS